jgi:hypothetical protein
MRVQVGLCNVKSKLLHQRMWLNNDDSCRDPLLRGLVCFRGLGICRGQDKGSTSLVKNWSYLTWGVLRLGNDGTP